MWIGASTAAERAPRQFVDRAGVAAERLDDDEFVAAEPRDEDVAQFLAQPRRDSAQQFVADRMAERVVDRP